LFTLELSRVIVEDAEFICTSVEKQIFVKHLKDEYEKQCVTCVTVDDALVMSNDQSLIWFPGMGCVFHYSGPVVIIAASDSACGIFPDGRSSSAHIISVGPDNAPFICSGKAQEPVATCPMTAEYYAAGSSCSDIIHYRQLADDLGWPQVESTVLCLDNKTALALAVAPEVSKKSKHIFIKYHNIRWLVSINVISLKYIPTKQMRANVITKALSRTMFLLERDILFNRSVIHAYVCG
jgi:hypothetical protein